MKSKILILGVVAILLVAGVGFWFWQRKGASPVSTSGPGGGQVQESVAPLAVITPGLGAELFIRSQNPLKDQLPATNPFNANETNPLKHVTKNPFR